MTFRLGWLADPETDVIGGAELTCRELLRRAPREVKIVPCPPDDVRRGCDAYVVHNVTGYPADAVEALAQAPVVKYVHDVHQRGAPELRDFLLAHAAAVIFVSPLQLASFPYPTRAPAGLMPPAIELGPFRRAARKREGRRRRGTIWIGQMTGAHKGLGNAVRWAQRNGTVDFYGAGQLRPRGSRVRYHGQVQPEDVPDLMARFKRFLLLPRGVDSCGRTVLEASAAGCELVVNERVGAMWWLRHRPEEVETGAERFWEVVRAIARGEPPPAWALVTRRTSRSRRRPLSSSRS